MAPQTTITACSKSAQATADLPMSRRRHQESRFAAVAIRIVFVVLVSRSLPNFQMVIEKSEKEAAKTKCCRPGLLGKNSSF